MNLAEAKEHVIATLKEAGLDPDHIPDREIEDAARQILFAQHNPDSKLPGPRNA